MKPLPTLLLGLVLGSNLLAQEMPDMWTNKIGGDATLSKPDTGWFEDAKFGIFVHWGLYSELAGEWKGKEYYGSGEWIMNRAKIPAAEYAETAKRFNPTGFDAKEWADFARDSGARYMVVTAKHHEGFAMFGSKVSPYNIVDATPYGKDPMKALSVALKTDGVKFGFYYSQFLDWHEPNGGGNRWDFKDADKDYKKYYAQKSIPQIKELLSNYGPLGVVWFDMPGGLTKEQTVAFMGQVRALQPQTLVSSRVGQGLGDFRDFGDSELPATPIAGAWEAIFTHNDSWGFIRTDTNFKTPTDLIHLLAATSARGGNLMVNVGPDGKGRIPEMSLRYFREVGDWLKLYGESIYGTRASPIPDQPWGVSTLKGSTLFLHVFTRPADGVVVVPAFTAKALKASLLGSDASVRVKQDGRFVSVTLPKTLPDPRDSVVALTFSGTPQSAWGSAPVVLSKQFDAITLEASSGTPSGAVSLVSKTSSRYFGNWKHDTCAVGMATPADGLSYKAVVREAGDYRVSLDYACGAASVGQDGVVEIGGQTLGFETALSGEFEAHHPLLFLHHAIGVVHLEPGETALRVHPVQTGKELFWLRRVVIEPVR